MSDHRETMSKPIAARGSADPARRGATAPWVVAVVLAVVVAALVLALVRSLSVGDDNDHNSGRLTRPSSQQLQAVQAGAVVAANLTTYSRKTYEADYRRALAGTTGALRTDLSKRKAAFLQAMKAGKFDLKASVVHAAFENASGSKVIVLVTLNGTHVVDGVANPASSPQRLELTMTQLDGKWVASNFTQVGVQ